MKKLTILLFSILISFNSYGFFGLFDKTVCVETDAQDRDGVIYLPNKTKPFAGKNLCEYENGQNKSKGKVEDGKKDGIWTEWEDNGQIKMERSYNFDQIVREKNYQNGVEINDTSFSYNLKGLLETKGNFKEGILVSQTSYQYFENGQIESEKNYKDGQMVQKQGLFKTFDKDGYVEKLFFYKNNLPVQEYLSHNLILKNGGKLQDVDWFDDVDGSLRDLTIIDTNTQEPFTGEFVYISEDWSMIYKYINGKFHGKGSEFGIDGKRTYRGETKMGMDHGYYEVVAYNDRGIIYNKVIGQYSGNKEDGKWTEWGANGQIEQEKIYQNGELVSKTKYEYYESGQKVSEQNYKDGKRDGKWTLWYENGHKESQSIYKDGKKHGKVTAWHENGQIKLDANWKDGKCISGDCPK